MIEFQLPTRQKTPPRQQGIVFAALLASWRLGSLINTWVFLSNFLTGAGKDFDFIIQNIQSKLAGWQANLLSLAGRHILFQSSFSAVAEYVMQGALLPNRICQEIDRANCNFLWEYSSEKCKLHLVNWEVVTRPTDHGGLGLHAARPRNLSLLAKLNWNLSVGDNSPWAKVLKAKYMSRSAPWSSKGSCS